MCIYLCTFFGEERFKYGDLSSVFEILNSERYKTVMNDIENYDVQHVQPVVDMKILIGFSGVVHPLHMLILFNKIFGSGERFEAIDSYGKMFFVVPVYNEEKNIKGTVDEILKLPSIL